MFKKESPKTFFFNFIHREIFTNATELHYSILTHNGGVMKKILSLLLLIPGATAPVENRHTCGGCPACLPPPREFRIKKEEGEEEEQDDDDDDDDGDKTP